MPPAIIVFAREPIAGRAKTRLIPSLGRDGAARLADAFIADALAKAAKIKNSRLVLAGDCAGPAQSSPYFRRLAQRFGAELIGQGKGHLGQRMARVLGRYSESAGAILMGTDTPSLPLSFIRESIEDLREAPVVIAPALDGGYYLVGVRGPLPDIFGALNWGGAAVMKQTLQRLRSQRIAYRMGRWWYDIDRAADLALLAADLEQGICGADRTNCPATAGLLRMLGLVK
jgi:rSAM/selenodomain-associated transferase 1